MAIESNGVTGNKSRGEETRQKLLTVGARLFAINGFKGVSMRSLAKEAEINIATVGYHFGGKIGLYEAILQNIIDRSGEFFPSMEGVQEHIAKLDSGDMTKSELVKWYFGFLINGAIGDPETEWVALIISRELAISSEHYSMLDEELFSPSFDSLIALLDVVLDKNISKEERYIIATSLIGLVLKFVQPKPFLHRVGWDKYTPEKIITVTEVLCRRVIGFVGCEDS